MVGLPWAVLALVLSALVLECPPGQAAVVLRTDALVSGGDAVRDLRYRHRCTIGSHVVGRVDNTQYVHYPGFLFPTGLHAADIAQPDRLPDKFTLGAASPNPMRGHGTIQYAVPVPSRVAIRLLDVTGRHLRTIIDQRVEPGYHRADFAARGLSAGVYFYRMDAPGFVATKKLIFLR